MREENVSEGGEIFWGVTASHKYFGGRRNILWEVGNILVGGGFCILVQNLGGVQIREFAGCAKLCTILGGVKIGDFGGGGGGPRGGSQKPPKTPKKPRKWGPAHSR